MTKHDSQGFDFKQESNRKEAFNPNQELNYHLGQCQERIEELETRIKELEQERKDLIEEFAEAECMGDLAKTARNHGYKG